MVEEKKKKEEECCGGGGPLSFWEVICIHKRWEVLCFVLFCSSFNLTLGELLADCFQCFQSDIIGDEINI